jgi:hypothetical protein
MSAGTAPPSSPKRRWFLKTALAVAAIGGAVGGGVWWRRGFADQKLTQDGRVIFRALASAIVGPLLPQDPAKRAATLDHYLGHLERAIADMPEAKRLQLALLTGALANAPTRFLATGVWSGWEDLTDEQVLQMLEGLRTAGSEAQHTIFVACRAITSIMFFSSPENWSLVGYPGPMPI